MKRVILFIMMVGLANGATPPNCLTHIEDKELMQRYGATYLSKVFDYRYDLCMADKLNDAMGVLSYDKAKTCGKRLKRADKMISKVKTHIIEDDPALLRSDLKQAVSYLKMYKKCVASKI